MTIRPKTKADNMEDLAILIKKAQERLERAKTEKEKQQCMANLKLLKETEKRNS